MEVENKYGLVISNNTNFVSCGNNKRIKKRSENENTNKSGMVNIGYDNNLANNE
jgi:hypothetical protein